jgi:hypothetical protein
MPALLESDIACAGVAVLGFTSGAAAASLPSLRGSVYARLSGENEHGRRSENRPLVLPEQTSPRAVAYKMWPGSAPPAAVLGRAGDRVADIADQSVDQRLVVRFTHHPDDRLGARRADQKPAL